MRKIVFFASTGYVGMDRASLEEVDPATTDKALDDWANDYALENADSFGLYPWPDDLAEDEISEEEQEHYTDNIEGWWEEYNPTEHDPVL